MAVFSAVEDPQNKFEGYHEERRMIYNNCL